MVRQLYLLVVLFSVGLVAQNKPQSVGFKENKGQIVDQKQRANPSVKYLLNTAGLNVQLKKNGFSYDVYDTEKIPLTEKDRRKKENFKGRDGEKSSFPDYSLKYVFHRVDISFEGSNPDVELVAEGKSKDYDNYYTVLHAPEGILMVHQYEKVTYRNLYPNIDVVFFVPEDVTKTVEYNFIVRPGGKVSDIRMKFDGVKTDLVDSKIKMQTRFGAMEETLPLSWTEDGNKREEIAIGYTKLKKNVYGFAGASAVATDKIIVIDPVPVRLWGTYYANEEGSSSGAVTTDILNNVYISGSTQSENNVATAGTHLFTFDADQNCYYAKIDTNGARVWGTYYSIFSSSVMVIDHDFSVLFGGSIINDEINIATPDSHQPIKSAINDMFIVKLNSLGIREWGTYYGDVHNDYLHSLAVDSFNNVYIAGQSESTENLTTPGSFQPQSTAAYQGILVKFSPSGERIWGTYYNGAFGSVNVSADDFLYITGRAVQTPNISTPGSYQENSAGGSDVFVVKFTMAGERIWGTFLGGPGFEAFWECRLIGNYLYLHGQTTSQSGMATSGTFIDNYSDLITNYTGPLVGNLALYVMKFNLMSQQKEWCTYFFENITSLDANENGEVFISGQTSTDDHVATPGAYMPERGTYLKGYFQKFNSTGQREWGSYFGGDKSEQFLRIKLDSFNDIYLSGTTWNSSTGIATTPGMISSSNTAVSAFLVKFRDCLSSVTVSSNSPVCINNAITLEASGGISYSWAGPNGFTSNLQNPTIASATVANAGEYFCTITGTGGCDDTKSVIVTVGNTVAPVPDIANLPTITGTCNTLVIPTPTATDTCMNSIMATTTSPLVYTLEGTYTVVWNYVDGNGNSVSQNQTVVITGQPLPVANATVTYCIQENKTLADVSVTGANIKWYDAQTGGNLLPDTTLLEDNHDYYASQTIAGCESERIMVTATIQHTFGPTGFAVQYFCDTQILTLEDFVVTGTNVVFYDSQFGGNILPMSTPLVDDMGYWASQTVNGCESSLRTPFISDITSDLPAHDFSMNACDNLNDGREKVDLSFYNEDIVPASSGYSFGYYTDFASADNEVAANEITDFAAYELLPGVNSVFVRVENTTLCYKVVELRLTLIPAPVLQMKDTYGLCVGKSVTITADPGFHTYTWSDTSLGQSLTVTEPGTYSVTVTEYHVDVLCSTTKTITVVPSDKPTITSIEMSDWTAFDNMLTVIVSGGGNYEYSLDGEIYQLSNQFTGLPNGEYRVHVRDIYGCGVDDEDVYLLMYPKFFTPNGDGYNDAWGIKFYKNELNMVVKIFDRQGRFIKQLTDRDPLWDGMQNGQLLPATDYWFTVVRENGKEHKGHFSLKR